MATLDPIVADLQQKYKPLEGVVFQGTYEGVFNMPQTDNPRDIISIKPTVLSQQPGIQPQVNPFAATLQGLSEAVVQAHGENVWKGITGPAPVNRFTDYWLWVEPGLNQVLAVGSSDNFQIEQCTVFQRPPTSDIQQFKYGVSIKISRVIPMPCPQLLSSTYCTVARTSAFH